MEESQPELTQDQNQESSNNQSESEQKYHKKGQHHNTQREHRQRTFTISQKEECWNQAQFMLGRSPERWRLDALGNPVCKALRGCFGPLCHEYDHIYPFSKGGSTTVDNCHILQTKLNKIKSNKIVVHHYDLNKNSTKHYFAEEELDMIEKAVYGDIIKPDLSHYVDYRNRNSRNFTQTGSGQK